MEATKTILIVDDEQDICEFLSYNLRKHHYQVYIAFNGQDALKQAGNLIPDLIIADIMMPEMNGITMCRLLKGSALTKNIPVLFLSASSDDYHLLSAMEAGGADYLSKPVRPARIVAKVKEVMQRAA